MEHTIPKLIRLKEKELATLEKRTSDRRATLERELATLDERAQQERRTLEHDIRVLHQAAKIEQDTLSTASAPPKNLTKQEREELFDIRSQVMRRLLDHAHGEEVHTRELAEALHRPESTIKDYYNEQLELRPAQCFWQNGVDKSHFRWRDDQRQSEQSARVASHAGQPAARDRWRETLP